MTDYNSKYLKYKTKYLNLKNNMVGGKPKKYTISLYKANWCGHCKTFLPTWNKVQQDVTNNNVKFETIEYEDNKEYVKNKKVLRFPTIHINDIERTERDYDELFTLINNLQ